MTIDITRGGRHHITWHVDIHGLITESFPEEAYTGCRVVDLDQLRVGAYPRYQLPPTATGLGKVVELRIPVSHINP